MISDWELSGFRVLGKGVGCESCGCNGGWMVSLVVVVDSFIIFWGRNGILEEAEGFSEIWD